MGEMSFAKLIGVYWDYSTDKFVGGDVGHIQVRTTQVPAPHAHLIMRPANDKPTSLFVLMTGQMGEYSYQGWLGGSDGMRDEWFRTAGPNDDREPCWWVPFSALTLEFSYE